MASTGMSAGDMGGIYLLSLSGQGKYRLQSCTRSYPTCTLLACFLHPACIVQAKPLGGSNLPECYLIILRTSRNFSAKDAE